MSDTIHIHIERECPVRVITVEPTGARGAAGNAATVSVGTTTTGAAGTNASVTNSGTTSAAVFNFTIPRGDTGAAGASGGSSTAWRYKAKTNATSGYPTNGHLLWNNATQNAATEILVSHLDDEGTDVELLLSFFLEGQKIFIQNRDDSSQNQVWEISGTPTVTNPNTSTAYYTFPVTLISSAGGEFNNNHSILFGSIAAAVNAVTSATTSDGTASLDISNLTLSQDVTSGLQTKMTFTANPTAVGDGQQIIWQWYNGGSPVTTAAITTEATGSTSDKLLFKTSFGGSVGTSLDLTYTVATFSGSISSLGESYRSTSTFTYAAGVAATHRTALGLTTLATTTPAANVATFLATPTSANLAAAVTDETGSGSLVFGTSPSLTSPTIGTSATFNATTYTYGAGAALAHRNALGIYLTSYLLSDGPIINNSTTLVNTGLELSLTVGLWLVDTLLFFRNSTNAAGGKAKVIVASGTATNARGASAIANFTLVRQASASGLLLERSTTSAIATDGIFCANGVLNVTADCVIRVQYAQGAAQATDSNSLAGSYMTAQKIN